MNTTERLKKKKERERLGNKLPRSVGVPYATGVEWRNTPERMKRLSQSRNYVQLWMCLVVKAKLNAVKNNIA